MLSWWVERGAFDSIEISFLPVGHTHNEPDQVASRCSICCRTRDIPTRTRYLFVHKYKLIRCFYLFFFCRLTEELEGCYRTSWSQKVVSQSLEGVADTKTFLNPDGNPRWTGPNAKSYFCHGIGGPKNGQSDLHWFIDKVHI